MSEEEKKFVNASHFMPLEILDKCIGKQILIITRGDYEITGKLLGYDDYINLVLDDVTETEYTPEGKKVARYDQQFLNSSSICMLVPDAVI